MLVSLNILLEFFLNFRTIFNVGCIIDYTWYLINQLMRYITYI